MRPRDIKLKRKGIHNVIGQAGDIIVKVWNVAMDLLVNTKKAKKISSGLVGGCATIALPEGGAEIVSAR